MEKLLLILQIASTLFLTGLIWLIQIVQYPFFSHFSAENFTKYHDEYRFRITPVVAPPMLVELVTSIFLLVFPPAGIDAKLLWLAFGLTLAIWASTFFVQVPLHEKLAAGFDAAAHSALVRTNWIRTAAWSLRAFLVLYFAWKTIHF